MLDLYHRTTPERAETILREHRMASPELNADGEPAAFFSTVPDGGHASGYGDAVVHVRVPGEIASLEDEFPSGEQHYSVPVRCLRPEHFVGEQRISPRSPA